MFWFVAVAAMFVAVAIWLVAVVAIFVAVAAMLVAVVAIFVAVSPRTLIPVGEVVTACVFALPIT